MRSCKVIATCFTARDVRTEVSYPYHNQQIRSPEESLRMLRKVLEIETGPATIIVVNNRAGFLPGDRYLDTLSSDVLVEHRANFGGAFGAYDYAFQKYRDRFDYWLFTEDDVVILHPYQHFIQRFEGEVNCGLLALVGRSSSPAEHAHGGIGLSRREVLERVCERNGGHLPHPNSNGWKRREVELAGEVAFGQAFIRAGYRLVSYGDDRRWHPSNGCLPYYDWSRLKG